MTTLTHEYWTADRLPSNWKLVHLGDVCEHNLGKMLDREKNQGELRPYLRNPNVQWFEFDLSDVQQMPIKDSERSKFALAPGDVVICEGGEAGRAAIWTDPDREMYIQKALHRVRVKPCLYNRFLVHVLMADSKSGRLNSYFTGTTIPHFTGQDLHRYVIPLPPLPKQKQIADILDKADSIRRKRQKAAKLCNDFLTSAFNTVFGDPVLNPNKWPETTLEEVAHLQSGVTKGRNFGDQQTIDVPYMRVWNVQDGHLRLDDIKDITVLPSDVEKYSLQVGDLLLTEGGDPDQLGRGAIWYAPIPVCIHQNHIFRVRCDQKLIIPEFLSALIGSQKGKRYFLKMAKQTTGIASINMTQLKKCPVFLPPLHLQQQFANLDRRFEKTCETLNKRFDTVDQLFGSLVQRAFNGTL